MARPASTGRFWTDIRWEEGFRQSVKHAILEKHCLYRTVKMPIPVKDEGREAVTRARRALLDCLAQVPFLRAAEVALLEESPFRPDLAVRVEWLDCRRQPLCLVAEVKASGEPRHARLAVQQLFHYTQRLVPGSYGVFIAPYIAPDTAALCEREGCGYLDFAGNYRVVFDQVYLHREGRPNPFPSKREQVSLYKPKAERVLRVLLCHPHRVWRLQELAEVADVSLGYTHRIKEQLLDREWLGEEPDGVRLLQPARMLRAWAENYDFSRHRKHSYHTLLEIGEVEAALAECAARDRLRYAFTGFSGAARVAPHVRYQRVHAYVDSRAWGKLVEVMALRQVSAGPNVILMEPHDEGVFYGAQSRDGAWVASPVQLFLDLRKLPGRGEDAAEHLLDTVLVPQMGGYGDRAYGGDGTGDGYGDKGSGGDGRGGGRGDGGHYASNTEGAEDWSSAR
jgi:hypothetical protein